MKHILLIKEIYLEAFKNLGPVVVKNFFKILTWFCLISFIIVLYAFIFRVATGFAFD
jgi:hypothetical protein